MFLNHHTYINTNFFRFTVFTVTLFWLAARGV